MGKGITGYFTIVLMHLIQNYITDVPAIIFKGASLSVSGALQHCPRALRRHTGMTGC